VLLPNQKSTAKTELKIGSENCITADSEISSQKLCRCRFINQQSKTVIANSKIGSDGGVILTLLFFLVFT